MILFHLDDKSPYRTCGFGAISTCPITAASLARGVPGEISYFFGTPSCYCCRVYRDGCEGETKNAVGKERGKLLYQGAAGCRLFLREHSLVVWSNSWCGIITAPELGHPLSHTNRQPPQSDDFDLPVLFNAVAGMGGLRPVA